MIRAQRPELVFLEVELPKHDAFAILAEFPRAERPPVVFTTVSEAHAVRAFEAGVLDYLVKPVAEARLGLTLLRAREELEKARNCDVSARVEQLLDYVRELTGKPPAPHHAPPRAGRAPSAAMGRDERIVLKTGTELHFVKAHDIIWVEAEGDFVKVHATGQAQLVRETFQAMERKLDAAHFLRIHRSFIVNLEHVRKVTPALYGESCGADERRHEIAVESKLPAPAEAIDRAVLLRRR